MTRGLEVDEEAAEEAEAQVRYYSERAGTQVALRFVAEIEAIYVGLVEGRFVGVNHPRVTSDIRDVTNAIATVQASAQRNLLPKRAAPAAEAHSW